MSKAEQKERTRATILESAARLVRERGIAGARVADVMQGAGLTVGGFYAHFVSKEALVDETLSKTAAAMRKRLFLRLEEKPAADRANVIVKRYLSAAHRDERDTGCPIPAVSAEVSMDAAAHRHVLARELRAMADEISDHLPRDARIATRDLSLGLVALMVGGLTLARATARAEGPNAGLSDDFLKASRALARLVLEGASR